MTIIIDLINHSKILILNLEPNTKGFKHHSYPMTQNNYFCEFFNRLFSPIKQHLHEIILILIPKVTNCGRIGKYINHDVKLKSTSYCNPKFLGIPLIFLLKY